MTKKPPKPEPGAGPAWAVDKDGDAAADEIAALAALISQARELVNTGHTIDLAGLSEKINDFCGRLAKNPPKDVDSVARMIEALVGDLNRLAEEIAEQHRRVTSGGKPGKGNGS